MDPVHGDTGSKFVALAAMVLVVACVSGTRLTHAKPSDAAHRAQKGHFAFTKVSTTPAHAYLASPKGE